MLYQPKGTMHRFHLCDNILYMDDTCLYRSPTELVGVTPLQCMGTLVRLSERTMVDDHGLSNYVGSSTTMSPLDAVCVLVHAGHSVTLEEWVTEDTVTDAEGTVRIPVREPFSLTNLVTPPSTASMVDCNQTIRPRLYDGRGFSIVVTYDTTGVSVVMEETLFRTVIDTPSYLLRVSHDIRSTPRVVHYVDRILVSMHPLPPDAPCGAVLIDERGERTAYEDGISSESLEPIASIILNVDMVIAVNESNVLRSLWEFLAERWYTMLRDMWVVGTEDILLQLMRHVNTPDCIVRCIDPSVLINKRRRNERIDVLGMTIVRRMKCCDATRYVDMRASMFAHHGVSRIEVLPIARSRFQRLYDIGVFYGMPACGSGVLVNVGGGEIVMCVPMDSRTLNLTEAVATLLLNGSSELSGDCPITSFGFSVIYQETSSQCPPSETLLPFRLVVDVPTRTLQLMEDVEQDRFDVATIRSVDELERMVIPCDESRTRRRDVAILFPEMSKRVEMKSSEDVSACLREVQSRRVVREWCLEAMDAGHNMSGLGMTLMLHVLLSQWLGARCRVAQSRSGAALLAVYVNGAYEFVDPCRTLCNFFTLSRELAGAAVSSATTTPRDGMVVEVRKGGQWHVGVVRTVEVDRGSMIVQTAVNDNRFVVSIGGHGWRRVGQDTSDTDRIVRPLLLTRKRQRS